MGFVSTMTPTGLEELPESLAFTQFTELGCNAGCNELAELWPSLDDEARAAVLAFARGLSDTKVP